MAKRKKKVEADIPVEVEIVKAEAPKKVKIIKKKIINKLNQIL